MGRYVELDSNGTIFVAKARDVALGPPTGELFAEMLARGGLLSRASFGWVILVQDMRVNTS